MYYYLHQTLNDSIWQYNWFTWLICGIIGTIICFLIAYISSEINGIPFYKQIILALLFIILGPITLGVSITVTIILLFLWCLKI